MNGIWTINDSKFSCNLEWLPGSGDEAIDYWTSKGRMRRGQAPAGYHITMRISPPNEYLSRQILGLLIFWTISRTHHKRGGGVGRSHLDNILFTFFVFFDGIALAFSFSLLGPAHNPMFPMP